MNIIKVLIHGNRDYIKVFRFLKHYHMDIDYLDEYDGRELDYNLIITNNTFLDSLKNYNGLIFNVSPVLFLLMFIYPLTKGSLTAELISPVLI